MTRRNLVTGGGGFLGGAIVRKLREHGQHVRSISRGHYPELERLGVECMQADLGDVAALTRAAEGCDVVFHVAARAGIWGAYDDFHRVNVVGTENVLAACRANGIARLVYTSSPSVVFDGRDMEGTDESAPYPKHYEAAYPQTKALAEQAVRAANGPDLATVALRPHLIWGPGDPHLTPRILARGRSGRLRRIGPGTNRVHTVYVDNAADAHLLAADRLAPGSPIAGRVYFIAQDEPRPLWEVIDRILAAGGVPPVTRGVPTWAAVALGAMIEGAYRLLRLSGEPPMTRFVARELATAHWFDLSAARRDLGFVPAVSFEEGMRRLADSLKKSGRD
jgi:nucleoside-diphosphate-sugar epimerase